MTTPRSNYAYTSLLPRHIRILEFNGNLDNTQGPESFTWSLKAVPFPDQALQDVPIQYDALSYTWGTNPQMYPLICDGQRLEIHHNLHEALPYLVRRASTLPLWIDAVCINQSDEKEKVEQIRLMSDIYRQANRVWAWLGVGEEPGTREAVEIMLPRLEEAAKTIKALPEDHTLTPSQVGLPELDSPAWDALRKLANSAWFLRLWVVQEVTLAREITFLYGTYQISDELLYMAVDKASSLSHIRGEQGRKLDWGDVVTSQSYLMFLCRERYQVWEQRGDTSRDAIASAVGIIYSYTISHKCFDPRDRVLALLGLAGDTSANEIHFNEKTCIVDLYAQFVHFLLHGAGRNWHIWNAMLEFAVRIPNKGPEFPSWCPDLHRCHEVGNRDSLRPGFAERPASTRQRVSRRGQSLREIVIRGTIFDSVDELGQKYVALDQSNVTGFFKWISDFKDWEKFAAKLALPLLQDSHSGDNDVEGEQLLPFLEHDYWLTLIGSHTGRFKESLTYEGFLKAKSFANDYSAFAEKTGIVDRINQAPEGTDPFTEAESNQQSELMKRFLSQGKSTPASQTILAVSITQQDRSILRTTGRRLGHALGDILPGDRVVLFDGATTPHLIRMCKEGPRELYQLVGIVYLHGVMHGEVDNWGLKSQDITLV